MRKSQIFSAAAAIAATAQAQSFSVPVSRGFSSVGDVQPTVTETVSGPIQTGQACSQVAELILDSRLQYPSVEAEVSAEQYNLATFNLLTLQL
jgi:hypothetical protein